MGTKYEVNQNTGDITGTGTATLPGGHFTQSLTISGLPVATGTINGLGGAVSIVGDSFLDVSIVGSTIKLSADAIIAGTNITVSSGTSGVTINSTATGGNGVSHAIVAPTEGLNQGLQVVSGTSTVNLGIKAITTDASGFLSVASGTSTIQLSADAITSLDANLTVTSGSNAVQLDFSDSPTFSTISGTSGLFGGGVSAQTGTFSTTLTVSGIPVRLASDAALSFTHTQNSPATTWTVTHGLGTLTPLVNVYNTFNEMIQPNTASGISTSQYELKFNTSIAGKAFFAAQGAGLDLGNMSAVSAVIGSFTTVTGVSGQFSEGLSCQTLTSSNGITVSGVPVPLVATPHVYRQKTGTNQAYTASAETSITEMVGVPLPTGHFGSTNGRTYRVTGAVSFNNGTASNTSITVFYYYGPNGTAGENTGGASTGFLAGNGSETVNIGPKQFTVTSGTANKFGVTISCGQNGTILGQGSDTMVLIELVG